MYSRSHFSDRQEPYRIPENYHGNAFHAGSITPEAPPLPPPIDETPASEPVLEAATPNTGAPESDTPPSAPPKTSPSFLSSLLPPKPRGIHGGILGDIGAEDLLILGVLLLLSQNDSDDDIVLLLLLLLFYK